MDKRQRSDYPSDVTNEEWVSAAPYRALGREEAEQQYLEGLNVNHSARRARAADSRFVAENTLSISNRSDIGIKFNWE